MAPPTMVVFLFRHTWAVFILMSGLNALVWRRRCRPVLQEKPELRPAFDRMIRDFLTYGNAPWLVMGAGILFGGVPDTLHYFNPRNGPFVLAFYASVVALWVLSLRWIFLRGGAEQLAGYTGMFGRPVALTPALIKLYLSLMIAGGIAGLTMMLTQDIRIPALGSASAPGGPPVR